MLQCKMFQINFLRHIQHLNIKASIHMYQIQNSSLILCFSEYRRCIYTVFLHLIVIKKLLQAIQHTTQPVDRSKGQFLIQINFFTKSNLFSHFFNNLNII